MFIERINERDKAHRLIALVGAQTRNIVDKQCVEMLRQCEVIRRASWLPRIIRQNSDAQYRLRRAARAGRGL